MTRTSIIALLLIAAAFVTAAVLYDKLPNPVPVHFDLRGNPNGWMMKPWGAIFSPLMMVGIAIVLGFARLRVASERGEDAARTLDLFSLLTLGFLLEVTVVVLLVASGSSLPLNAMVFGAVGLLYVVMGNWFGKLQRNSVVGIRTARTMTDDENWLMTHRFGGRVFVIGGLALFFAAVLRAAPWIVVTLILVIPMAPAIYSYTRKP